MTSSTVEVLLIGKSKPPRCMNGIYKVYASEAGTIPPHRGGRIKTGFKLRIPGDHYARITASAVKALGGVIDSDYRGEVCVLVYNDMEREFVFREGDEVGEMCVLKIVTPVLQEAN
jgi:dUTP pyrophosphatase